MDATAAFGFGRQDTKILGLIGTGHFLSHFFFLTLPPLFPYLKEAFAVGYTELGLMMTLTYAASATAQVPVGFLVDRIGARLVLTAGLALLAVGFGLVGLAPSFAVVIALTVLAGIGTVWLVGYVFTRGRWPGWYEMVWDRTYGGRRES